ncbi:MAG: hypothetical protein A3I44_03355 [Candidatus Sungbacteria bacterium RIFCSPLOWO2_02_FULL_51_17]|uniref:DUF4115 domain-containing protein n=1 Tax=Candidatus Sungbacteria bacterium RIFCSPHIGHO2_02_FULL_51_29 TaxID=1802273 RepID=A0A1G2KP91_9BACT|nr:MAG: hypothetical protein A2676_01280 [Candidatus Sungbacteria bacterium RIFCSPHIGHO2_01_FULL_51_22]OHA01216.1 MAG: hypothetical protein A3C16_00820 [Candidatus Sungbacteria bacterium RIFCSPHIGHO2_02_FULL_51_29]OHA04601.1 MAG: hypothetical protein A3B29_04425 [Candidatus Sungbacteria bacterium RIFCSPLOWO2_01_FULL_51_34]OHA12288.1 MAG: hypothetical protein A3I44_03355 [Candidatus Sungbacteria bacterium RIFCSPLOWO2_02_FULL_51_17]
MPDVEDHFGRQLKDARERFRVSIRAVAEETRTPVRFIEQLEAWDFHDMGARVYASGFFKKYAAFLGLLSDEAVHAFDEGWYGAYRETEGVRVQESRARRFRGMVVGERTLAVVGGTLALVLVLGYLVYAVLGTVFPPRLDVRYPAEDITTDVPVIDVEGIVKPETSIVLSGRPVYVDENGRFKERIHLDDGLNALEVEAKNTLGKVTKITRYVLLIRS